MELLIILAAIAAGLGHGVLCLYGTNNSHRGTENTEIEN
jgi:hypothetical protein